MYGYAYESGNYNDISIPWLVQHVGFFCLVEAAGAVTMHYPYSAVISTVPGLSIPCWSTEKNYLMVRCPSGNITTNPPPTIRINISSVVHGIV